MALVLQLREDWKRQVRVTYREEGERGRKLARRITDLAYGGHGVRSGLGEGMRNKAGVRGEPA